MKKQLYCIGGICRETGDSFFEFSISRNCKKMSVIITKYVEKGTTIYTEEWNGNRKIDKEGYINSTVCHKENSVNPRNPSIKTQKIEILCKYLKKYMKLYGNNLKKKIKNYILKYRFKRESYNVFNKFLSLLSKF